LINNSLAKLKLVYRDLIYDTAQWLVVRKWDRKHHRNYRFGFDIYKYFVLSSTLMSEDVFAEDKAVKKILQDETLDEESTAYDVSETQSDSNQADAEKDNTEA
jgi:hypothetical protein